MIVCVGLVHWILPGMHAIIERTNVAHKWDLKNYAINICCHFVCTCRHTCTLCKSSNMWYSCSEYLRVESRLNGLRYVVFPMSKKFPQSLNLTLFLRWQLPLNSKLICLLYMNIWADYTWIFLLTGYTSYAQVCMRVYITPMLFYDGTMAKSWLC